MTTRLGLLDSCLSVIDKDESNSIPVTLFVGGNIVSGDMISKNAYYNGVAETLASVSGDQERNKTKVIGERIKRVLEEAKTFKRPQEESLKTEKAEIFLKNIKLLASENCQIMFNNGFMALRIDAIDGFMWGISSIA